MTSLSATSDLILAELTANLPPSLASDPGLSADVRKIDDNYFFVFTNGLACERCINGKRECVVRVEGYIRLLQWCYGISSGGIDSVTRARPRCSQCRFCRKGRSPSCQFPCTDSLSVEPRGRSQATQRKRPAIGIESTNEPMKKKRKQSHGSSSDVDMKPPIFKLKAEPDNENEVVVPKPSKRRNMQDDGTTVVSPPTMITVPEQRTVQDDGMPAISRVSIPIDAIRATPRASNSTAITPGQTHSSLLPAGNVTLAGSDPATVPQSTPLPLPFPMPNARDESINLLRAISSKLDLILDAIKSPPRTDPL